MCLLKRSNILPAQNKDVFLLANIYPDFTFCFGFKFLCFKDIKNIKIFLFMGGGVLQSDANVCPDFALQLNVLFCLLLFNEIIFD